MERELKDVSEARKRLEKGLEAQKKTSRRQRDRARELERQVKSMSKDEWRVGNLVQPQQLSRVPPRPGSENMKCVSPCKKEFVTYGIGAIDCPHCGHKYNNDEARWNSLPWTVPGSKTAQCSGCDTKFKMYGAGAINCPSCAKHYNNPEANWNSFPWDT